MRYRKLTVEYRLTQRWYPKGAMQINSPDDLGVCYVSPWRADGTWQIVAYAGTAGKPSIMSGKSMPHIDTTNPDPSTWTFADLKEPVERHKATSSGNGSDYVCFTHGSGSKWDGKERYASWYA